MKPRPRTTLHSAFHAGITLKGIDGLLELIGGLLLWLIPHSAVNAIVRVLSRHELSRDPQDFIAVHLIRALETMLGTNRLLASLYLLAHGAIKLVLVVALWLNALWAYPLTVLVFAAFCAFQLYQYSHTHSITWLVLTAFDGLLIWLTWLEWREQAKGLTTKKT